MKTLTIASLVAGLALTAGVSASASEDAAKPAAHPPAKRACFFASQINGWREGPDEKVVYLDVGVRDVYRLDLFGPCHGVDTAQTIGVQTHGGGSSICDGLDVTLITNSPVGDLRCPVSKITRLTPEEVAALTRKPRP
jgi:hypothetical protein